MEAAAIAHRLPNPHGTLIICFQSATKEARLAESGFGA
jgi:hypothetical protein